MNTTKKTASNNTILAIDLGKYKSVVCILDESNGEFRFTTFDTSRAERSKLLSKEQPTVRRRKKVEHELKKWLAGHPLFTLVGIHQCTRE